MHMYPWRRFRSRHAGCVDGSKGLNYTSHHLRCEQLDKTTKPSLCGRKAAQPATFSFWPGSSPSRVDTVIEVDDSVSLYQDLEEELSQTSTLSVNSSKAVTSDILPNLESLSVPPRCQLRQARLVPLILYITFSLLCLSTSISASPIHFTHRVGLHPRQAIPDKFGNTGNLPISQQSPIPQLPNPTTSIPTPSLEPSSVVPLNTTTPQPTILSTTPSARPSATPSVVNGINPLPSAFPLTRTSPQLPISPAAIAGLAGGAFVLLVILVLIAVAIYRRRRIVITEIPKIPGDIKNDTRRSPSWGSDVDQKKQKEKDKKQTKERPSISRPMPGRPVSAEPLGRLSGMGMGMGYLK